MGNDPLGIGVCWGIRANMVHLRERAGETGGKERAAGGRKGSRYYVIIIIRKLI